MCKALPWLNRLLTDWCSTQSTIALQQLVDDLTAERDQVLRSNSEDKNRLKAVEKDLAKALANRK